MRRRAEFPAVGSVDSAGILTAQDKEFSLLDVNFSRLRL
jgi:hypothetical protein